MIGRQFYYENCALAARAGKHRGRNVACALFRPLRCRSAANGQSDQRARQRLQEKIK
jgi:hypothetical protein